jgi:hypothetical protein
VIGAIAAGARVLRLHGLDKSVRELEVARPGHARKIGGQEPRRPRLVASTPNVTGELTKASVACRCTLVPKRGIRVLVLQPKSSASAKSAESKSVTGMIGRVFDTQ